MLEFNVDLDAKNIYKLDAMTIACMKREGMILKKILGKINNFQPQNHCHLLALVIKKSDILQLHFVFFLKKYDKIGYLDILEILLNFGFQIKDSDLQLALESGDSQIWWVLKSKRDEGMTEIQKKNCLLDEEFSLIREENETLKKKIQEYEVFLF